MKKFDKQIKSFLKRKMYFHQKVHSKTNLGGKIIKNLFIKIRKNPKKFIINSKNNDDNLERAISSANDIKFKDEGQSFFHGVEMIQKGLQISFVLLNQLLAL